MARHDVESRTSGRILNMELSNTRTHTVYKKDTVYVVVDGFSIRCSGYDEKIDVGMVSADII